MAKPEYAIREVSLAEVILFLLSAIILAAYHFDYRVATYIIFLDFFQSFKIIVALRQLMETKRHQKMFGSLPDAANCFTSNAIIPATGLMISDS